MRVPRAQQAPSAPDFAADAAGRPHRYHRWVGQRPLLKDAAATAVRILKYADTAASRRSYILRSRRSRQQTQPVKKQRQPQPPRAPAPSRFTDRRLQVRTTKRCSTWTRCSESASPFRCSRPKSKRSAASDSRCVRARHAAPTGQPRRDDRGPAGCMALPSPGLGCPEPAASADGEGFGGRGRGAGAVLVRTRWKHSYKVKS